MILALGLALPGMAQAAAYEILPTSILLRDAGSSGPLAGSFELWLANLCIAPAGQPLQCNEPLIYRAAHLTFTGAGADLSGGPVLSLGGVPLALDWLGDDVETGLRLAPLVISSTLLGERAIDAAVGERLVRDVLLVQGPGQSTRERGGPGTFYPARLDLSLELVERERAIHFDADPNDNWHFLPDLAGETSRTLGTLALQAVLVPEPGSGVLCLAGLLLLACGRGSRPAK
jgi:hypothetical protein